MAQPRLLKTLHAQREKYEALQRSASPEVVRAAMEPRSILQHSRLLPLGGLGFPYKVAHQKRGGALIVIWLDWATKCRFFSALCHMSLHFALYYICTLFTRAPTALC